MIQEKNEKEGAINNQQKIYQIRKVFSPLPLEIEEEMCIRDRFTGLYWSFDRRSGNKRNTGTISYDDIKSRISIVASSG